MQPPSTMSSNGGPARPSAPSYANRGAQHAGRYGPGFQQQQQQQPGGLTGADGLLHDRASFELTEEDVDAIRLRFQSGMVPTHDPDLYPNMCHLGENTIVTAHSRPLRAARWMSDAEA